MTKLTLTEYLPLAVRTRAKLPSYKEDLMHMVIGMSSEINELVMALNLKDAVNIAEELADIQWYFANYCDLTSDSIEKYEQNTNRDYADNYHIYLGLLTHNISVLNDLVKKHAVYNKELNIDEQMRTLNGLQIAIHGICSCLNLDIESALYKNIEKLKVRFPEKYSDYNANNRNLELEREKLE